MITLDPTQPRDNKSNPEPRKVEITRQKSGTESNSIETKKAKTTTDREWNDGGRKNHQNRVLKLVFVGDELGSLSLARFAQDLGNLSLDPSSSVSAAQRCAVFQATFLESFLF